MSFKLATSYVEARESFRHAADRAGARLSSYSIEGLTGADGEELAIDVATLGPEDPRATLFILAGTHGPEGYTGSALQIDLMDEEVVNRPDVRVVLVHALNPYGFSHHSRTDEHNVDLNRNFVRNFPGARNNSYDHYRDIVEPRDWKLSDLDIAPDRVTQDLEGFQRAVQRGQYHRPGGLFFGGTEPSWSRRQIEDIIPKEARGGFVGLIDIHTGLGESGAGEVMYTGTTADPSFADAQHMLPGEKICCPGATASVSARVEGTLVGALSALLPDARTAPVTLEFGVREFWPTIHALRGDAWLRRMDRDDAEARRHVRSAARAVFLDESEKWCSAVSMRGRSVVENAVNTLGT